MVTAGPAIDTLRLPLSWLLLFPATYVFHILEEYYAGEGFHRWVRRVAGITLTPLQFIVINSVVWVAMLLATLTASYFPNQEWIIAALGVIVSINGVGHLAGTLYTRVYSPGLITGVAVWVPLGIYALVRTLSLTSPVQSWIGFVAGLLIQAMVSLLAFVLGGALENREHRSLRLWSQAGTRRLSIVTVQPRFMASRGLRRAPQMPNLESRYREPQQRRYFLCR